MELHMKKFLEDVIAEGSFWSKVGSEDWWFFFCPLIELNLDVKGFGRHIDQTRKIWPNWHRGCDQKQTKQTISIMIHDS